MDVIYEARHRNDEVLLETQDLPQGLKNHLGFVGRSFDVVLKHVLKTLIWKKTEINAIVRYIKESADLISNLVNKMKEIEGIAGNPIQDDVKKRMLNLMTIIYKDNEKVGIRIDTILFELETNPKFTKAHDRIKNADKKFISINQLIQKFHAGFDMGENFLKDLKHIISAAAEAATILHELDLKELMDEAAKPSVHPLAHEAKSDQVASKVPLGQQHDSQS